VCIRKLASVIRPYMLYLSVQHMTCFTEVVCKTLWGLVPAHISYVTCPTSHGETCRSADITICATDEVEGGSTFCRLAFSTAPLLH